MLAQYDPTVFDAPDRPGLIGVILTPEAGLTPAQRWASETDWLADRLSLPEGLVVDYGCGIGRMAARLDQPVLGVDISPIMRAEAPSYCASPGFGVVPPLLFASMVQGGLRVDGAMAVWCLQHVHAPAADIRLLARGIKTGGLLVVVNRVHRCVPISIDGVHHWWDDGQDIAEILGDYFNLVASEDIPDTLCEPGAYIRHYMRRDI